MSARSPATGTFPNHCVRRPAAKSPSAIANRAGQRPALLLRAAPVLLRRSCPVRPHLRHAFHVDRRTLTFLFRGHRLQEVERPGEILLDGLLGRGKIQAANLGKLVVGAEHLQSSHRLFRRSRERNSSKGSVFKTSLGCSHARRATMTPQLRTPNASREWLSLEITISTPRLRASRACTSLISSR